VSTEGVDCHPISTLLAVRRGSDGDAERGDGYKNVAGAEGRFDKGPMSP
jgi:hypothetical protein